MLQFDGYRLSACPACETDHSSHFDTVNGYDLRRCAGCGTVYTANVPSSSELAAYYAGASSLTEGSSAPKRNTLRRLKYRAFAAYLAYLCRHARPIRLLELGCSDGDLLEAVHHDARFQATGLEFGGPNVAYCQQMGYDVIQSDLETCQLAPDTFDAVVALHVVEHMQDPVRTLREVHRVLKPGGYLFAVMPCISHPKARIAGTSWKYIGPPDHLWYFTTGGLAHLVRRLGFECRYSSALYHRAHVRVLARKPVAR